MGASCGGGHRPHCCSNTLSGHTHSEIGSVKGHLSRDEFIVHADADAPGRPDTDTWNLLCGCSNSKAMASGNHTEVRLHSDLSAASTHGASPSSFSEVRSPSATHLASSPASAASCLEETVTALAAAAEDKHLKVAGSPPESHDGESCAETSHAKGMRNRVSRLSKTRLLDPLVHHFKHEHKKASLVLRPPSGNANKPGDYAWLEATLELVAKNKAGCLDCKDLSTGKVMEPIFFVLGGCPNMLCGMQAVMYAVGADGDVDFWWVKPEKCGGVVQRETLSRHGKGPHKNDPGRSKPFYKPLADAFAGLEESSKSGTTFGIEKVDGPSGSVAPRAFVDEVRDGCTERLYVYAIWQEDWTTNPFARSKYIKGKVLYQKNVETEIFFSRQYDIFNGQLSLASREDPPFRSILPGDEVKELWE